MSTLIKKNGTWEKVAGPNAAIPLTITKTALIGDTPIANLKAYKTADGTGTLMFFVEGPNINIPAEPSGSPFQVIAHVDVKTPIRVPLVSWFSSGPNGKLRTANAAFLETNGDVTVLLMDAWAGGVNTAFRVGGTFICEE